MSSMLLTMEDVATLLLTIQADSAEAIADGYTHLDVHRSQLGANGPYEALTSTDYTAATLPEDADTVPAASSKTVEVVGLSMVVSMGLTSRTMTFTGTDPLTLSQCVTQINAVCAPLATALVNSANQVVLVSSTLGNYSSLSVSGEAAYVLGLPTDAVVYGKSEMIPLVKNVNRYEFRDYFGNQRFHYRTRFYHALQQTFSAWSEPFSGGSAADLDPSHIAIGYLDLCTQEGKALSGARVVIVPPTSLQGTLNKVVVSAPIEHLTDAEGHVEFPLVKGLRVTVVVPSIGMVREVVVPDAVLFDLASDEVGVSSDAFTVKRIDIAFGERRNF